MRLLTAFSKNWKFSFHTDQLWKGGCGGDKESEKWHTTERWGALLEPVAATCNWEASSLILNATASILHQLWTSTAQSSKHLSYKVFPFLTTLPYAWVVNHIASYPTVQGFELWYTRCNFSCGLPRDWSRWESSKREPVFFLSHT